MLSQELQIKPLEQWSIEYLEQVVAESFEESVKLELKEALPTNKGAKGWVKSGNLHSSERDGLAKEIVAFANSYGGHLIIGVCESSDHPKRADKLGNPIPNCFDLADRLSNAFAACIDPPIQGLSVRAVDQSKTSKTNSGYVVIRVPQSLSAPHGIGRPAAGYVRRADKSEPMTMRDMQDRLLESQTRRQRIEHEFQRFGLNARNFKVWPNSLAASLTVVPNGEIQIHDYFELLESSEFRQNWPDSESTTTASFARTPTSQQWKSTAYGVESQFRNSMDWQSYESIWSLDENGTLNVTGQRTGIPTAPQYGEISEIIDTYVWAFWYSCAARDILALQHCLSKTGKWITDNWFFRAELWSPNSRLYVKADPHFDDYQKCDFSSPVTTRAISFHDIFNDGQTQAIEQKILACFGLQTDSVPKVVTFSQKH